MIPLYIMEEHRDGFYSWRHAIDAGYLPPMGNCLIHVDHHDDLSSGSYAHDFTEPMTTLDEVLEFTDNALGIADFIVPAFYEGIFDEMLNFKGIFPTPGKEDQFAVKASASHMLSVSRFLPMVHGKHLDNPESPYRFFTMRESSLMPFSTEKAVVLDIDLDYFCWDHSLSGSRRICMEISREEYEAYQKDRHHPLKILPQRMIRAAEEEGRYYLKIQNMESPRKETAIRHVDSRINNFIGWLRENKIRPSVIDICRSRFSGYCPADRWEYIEKNLLSRLGELYELKPVDTPVSAEPIRE